MCLRVVMPKFKYNYWNIFALCRNVRKSLFSTLDIFFCFFAHEYLGMVHKLTECLSKNENHLLKIKKTSFKIDLERLGVFLHRANIFLLLIKNFEIPTPKQLSTLLTTEWQDSIKIHHFGELTDFHRNLRFCVQSQPQIRDFPVLLPSLKSSNFAHTCRRVKSSGVSESYGSNSFIFGVFGPIRSRYPTFTNLWCN